MVLKIFFINALFIFFSSAIFLGFITMVFTRECFMTHLNLLQIISNTTISRPDSVSKSPLVGETGGLSGRPLFDISTNVLKEMYILTRVCVDITSSSATFSDRPKASYISFWLFALPFCTRALRFFFFFGNDKVCCG